MFKIKIILNIIYYGMKNFFGKRQSIYYITENADWVIRDIGNSLNRYISNFIITTTHLGIRNSCVHYSSMNTFLKINGFKLPHKSNSIIVTVFHIVDGDIRVDNIKNADRYVKVWHTSCEITKRKLISFGASKEKIKLIPIGFDIDHFNEIDEKLKLEKRDELKIDKDSVVIGSFQKDGNGWTDGLEPKLIKGPDIFCDSVEKLALKYNIFILLTGPARGYVKGRLEKAGIKFLHKYLDNPNDVSKYFQLCDLYIIASREEGGPRSLLESMATGVPIVSTKVGMAPDMITNAENGFLVNINDVNDIFQKSSLLIENKKIRKNIINNSLNFVKNYDYSLISKKYEKYLYHMEVK